MLDFQSYLFLSYLSLQISIFSLESDKLYRRISVSLEISAKMFSKGRVLLKGFGTGINLLVCQKLSCFT